MPAYAVGGDRRPISKSSFGGVAFGPQYRRVSERAFLCISERVHGEKVISMGRNRLALEGNPMKLPEKVPIPSAKVSAR